jgi:hypothetical protein
MAKLLLCYIPGSLFMKTGNIIAPIFVFSTDVFIDGHYKFHMTVQKIRKGYGSDDLFSCSLTEIDDTDHPPVQFELFKNMHGVWVALDNDAADLASQAVQVINDIYADLMI